MARLLSHRPFVATTASYTSVASASRWSPILLAQSLLAFVFFTTVLLLAFPDIISHLASGPVPVAVSHIPRTIHQIWFQSSVYGELPSNNRNWVKSWRRMNPAFKHVLWDSRTADEFVRSHFENDTIDAYERLPINGQRADLLKLLILWVNGGIFADIDTNCMRPISQWWTDYNDADFYIGLESDFEPPKRMHAHIATWVILSVPRHPLLRMAIKGIIEKINAASDAQLSDLATVNDLGGIRHWTEVMEAYLAATDRRRSSKLNDITNHRVMLQKDHVINRGENASVVILRLTRFSPTSVGAEGTDSPNSFVQHIYAADRPGGWNSRNNVLEPYAPKGIPKKIHQIWWQSSNYSQISPKYVHWVKTWIDMNPDHEHILWDGAKCDAFVAGNFPPDIQRAYHKLPFVVQRTDFVRYLFLLKYGGIYSDMDTECLVPVTHILDTKYRGAGMIIGKEWDREPERGTYMRRLSVGQWSLISRPNHPLMAAIVDRLVDKILLSKASVLVSTDRVLELTGPRHVADVMGEYASGFGYHLDFLGNVWNATSDHWIGDVVVMSVGGFYDIIKHWFTGANDGGWKTKKPKAFIDEFPPFLHYVFWQSDDIQDIPPRFSPAVTSWQTHNPDLEIMIWDGTTANDFVMNNFGDEILRAYFKLPMIKQRVDLLKLLILHRIGGVYADLDAVSLTDIRNLTTAFPSARLILGRSATSHTIAPWTILARPNHPLLESLTDALVARINDDLSPSTLRDPRAIGLDSAKHITEGLIRHVASLASQDEDVVRGRIDGDHNDDVIEFGDIVVLSSRTFAKYFSHPS